MEEPELNRPQNALKGAGLGAATGFTFLAAEELVHFFLRQPSLRFGELLTLLPFYLVVPALFGAVLGAIGFRGVAAALWVIAATLAWFFAGVAVPSLGWLGLPMVLFGALATIVVILFLTRERESLRWGAWAGVWSAGVLGVVIDGSVLESVLSLPGLLVHLGLIVVCVALTLAFGKGLDRIGREPRPGVWTALLGVLLWPIALVLPDPASSAMPAQRQGAQGPPVVLVLVDGLAPEQLGPFGGPTDRTPTLDSLATRSYAFESAYLGSPSASAALATLFTGLLPSLHEADLRGRLLADRRTLAETYRDAGYQAGMVFSSPDFDAGSGLEQGFAYHERISGLGHSPAMIGTLDSVGLELLPQRHFPSADRVTDQAIAWLVSRPVSGTLTVVHYGNLLGQGQALEPQELDQELRRLDAEIARLLAAAGSDAWVVVTSTQGLRDQPGLDQPSVRVPLLVYRPRNLKPVTVLRAVSQADLLPTLLDVHGLASQQRLDGQSLFEVTGAVPPEAEPVVRIEHGADAAVVVAEWKLVQEGEQLELFQLAGPEPSKDQSLERPEVVEALKWELPGAEKPESAPSLDEALREHFERHFGEDLPANAEGGDGGAEEGVEPGAPEGVVTP